MIKQGQTIFLLNNYFSRRENLTWKTFLVELSRSHAKGAQLVTNLVTFAWAPFHLIKINVWFKILATSMQYRMEQYSRNIYPNFRKLSSGSFLSAFNFAPECLKFLVEWFAFRKRFRKSGNFSGKILYQLPLFPKFIKFWVLGKRPKCIQEILVLRESSARTTMCKKVCCTCKLNLLTLALLITSPG